MGDVEEKGKTVSKPLAYDLDIEVKLWYLPFGSMNADPFLWQEFNKTVSISKKGKEQVSCCGYANRICCNDRRI